MKMSTTPNYGNCCCASCWLAGMFFLPKVIINKDRKRIWLAGAAAANRDKPACRSTDEDHERPWSCAAKADAVRSGPCCSYAGPALDEISDSAQPV